ncbi:hypothetical protein [Brevibacillus massiliensis]|nr:hypothetical protein [Brevibacillus massiliensis]
MQAGRELDAKVAEALTEDEVEFIGGKLMWFPDQEGTMQEVPHFSTTWEGMGVLVEEAKKQGIRLEFSHGLNGGYYGGAYSFDDGEYQIDHSTNYAFTTAPHAVSLVFLMAKGVISNA